MMMIKTLESEAYRWCLKCYEERLGPCMDSTGVEASEGQATLGQGGQEESQPSPNLLQGKLSGFTVTFKVQTQAPQTPSRF